VGRAGSGRGAGQLIAALQLLARTPGNQQAAPVQAARGKTRDARPNTKREGVMNSSGEWSWPWPGRPPLFIMPPVNLALNSLESAKHFQACPRGRVPPTQGWTASKTTSGGAG